MKGFLPPELSLLTELKRFIAPGNRLWGNLDSAFHGLSNLDTVLLEKNRFTGTLPVDVIEQNPNFGTLVLTGTFQSSPRRYMTSAHHLPPLVLQAC